MVVTAQQTESRVQLYSPEQTREAFDDLAQELMEVSGAEFIRRWDAGEFADIADDPDRPEIMRLAMLIPFGR
ncbi:MAG: hypothetical protein QOG89_3598 [Thermomicrobiales bacterium]|nr:hypothetical protein [Thermomicrobiales bacterium]